MSNTRLVYADTFGSSWDTVLALSEKCPIRVADPKENQVTCSDDACDTVQSQVYAVMPYGRHYLVVSGVNGESGPVTIHFQHAQVGGGKVAALESGSGTVTGTTKDRGRMAMCEAPGPEDSYFWATCPEYEGGTLTASTCGGASFDTVLTMQVPRKNIEACANGDACSLQEETSLEIPPGAGIGVLTMDGDVPLAAGDYTMTYSLP